MPLKPKIILKQIIHGKKARVIKTGKEIPSWIMRLRKWIYLLALLAILFLVLESGLRWQLPGFLITFSSILDYTVFLCFLLDAGLMFYYTYPKSLYFKDNWLDILVFAPLILRLISLRSGAGLIMIRYLIIFIKTFTRTRKFSNLLHNVRLNTAQIVAISFVGTILVGTILLTFPSATADGNGASFVDALFTSTSATCVTGLIVQDTPNYFSSFGQIVILVLIQLGGLGIMTYSAFLALIVGRFSFGQRRIVQEMFEEERNIYNMIFYIFKMTLIIECLGILLLFARWIFVFNDPLKCIYLSIFHSISAFCNAGFSLFSDSLSRFVSDPITNIIMMFLIIVGGIGFITIHEIAHLPTRSKRALSTHTKTVLITSFFLIGIGFLAVFFFEFDGILLKYSIPAKLWASLFQSVTTRTAGFNTLPIESLTNVTLTIMIFFMFIGASPGSTGGGIKTTTFAVLLLSVRSVFKGEGSVKADRKTIPAAGIIKALALLVSALILVLVIFLLLLFTEDKPYLSLLFETISAFGTVGLSTGITPELTVQGKLLITLLMYIGRIGPLTMGLALTKEIMKEKIEYPETRILIG
ncbi:hypothetical protein JW824_05470 [bacterium]|nr:hypothetical protein [bacterium]RQV96326.1 MAG: hypothetical protein EH221_04975 [bacterium]